MLYRNLLLLLCTLFLSSCFGFGSGGSGVSVYKQDDFSIAIPSSWEIVSQTGGRITNPSEGKIELVANAPEFKSGFKNNLIILSDSLQTFTTSGDFMMLNHIGAQSEYISYMKLDSKDIVFADEEKSLLYIFEAKYNQDTPKLKFLQTAHVCHQTKGFVITLAIPTSVADTSKYEQLLASFKCL